MSGLKVLAVSLLMTGSAFADSFCADIDRFTSFSRAPTKRIITFVLPTPAAPQSECGYARSTEDSIFVHCAWPFAFRSNAATDAFEAVSQSLSNCPSAALRAFQDQTVNHPDSYELRIFDLPDAEVSVSLKDKGALQQTYVFMSIQAR